MRTIAGVVAAAILTFASLAHAQVTTPIAQPAMAPIFRLVWLISDRDGKSLGVFAFPEHLPLGICSRRADIDTFGIRPPFEQRMGNYLSFKLGVGLNPATPVCLTDAELAALVSAIKVQTDTPGEGV